MRCLVASSRVDITALLLCVERLMWSMCESVEELLRPDAARGSWMWSIHSLCNQLLAVLVILTSPLAELHRWHKSRDKLAGLLRTAGVRLVIWWECVYLFIRSLQGFSGRLWWRRQQNSKISRGSEQSWHNVAERNEPYTVHRGAVEVLTVLSNKSKCSVSGQWLTH